MRGVVRGLYQVEVMELRHLESLDVLFDALRLPLDLFLYDGIQSNQPGDAVDGRVLCYEADYFFDKLGLLFV